MTSVFTSTGLRGDYADTTGPVVARIFPGGAAGEWSVSLWVKLASTPPAGAVLLEVAASGAATPRLAVVSVGDGTYTVSITGAATNTATVSVDADNAWHNVIVAAEAEVSFVVYVDGAFGDNGATEETYEAADVLTLLDDSTHLNPAAGSVSGVAVFAYTLSEVEALATYNDGVDGEPGGSTDALATDVWLYASGAVAGTIADTGTEADSPLTVHAWSARAVPVGTHSIRVLSTLLDDADVSFEGWSFDFATPDDADTFGEAPRVTGTTGVRSDMTVALDAAMQPGIAYTLTPPEGDDFAITGPRRSLAREKSPDDRVLLDIDAPFIRPSGAGGDMTIGESGDYVLTGGLATIEKVIWDTVFSTKGERYWDPSRGTDLRHKQLRPLDARASQRALEAQIEAIPHVRAAVVQMLWDAGHMLISIRAETDFGRLETSRGVNDGD